MGIIIEDAEFNPLLRNRIAAFIDAFFEEPAGDDKIVFEEASVRDASADNGAPAWVEPPAYGAAAFPEELLSYAALEPRMAAAAAADEPPKHSRPSRTSRFSRGNMADAFGRVLESFKESRESKGPRDVEADYAESFSDAEAMRSAEAMPNASAISYSGAMPSAGVMPNAGAPSLKSWLDQVDEPFSTTVLALIDRKGLSDVDVYKRAHMSRQLFSRIRSDASYRPAKKTVLALAIAMGLSLDEMRDLLERAGFALSHSSKRDLIVEYFVTNGVYDLFAINEALYEFDQPLI